MFAIALFVVLPALALLFMNWQLVLIGLGIWMLMRPVVAAVDRRNQGERPAPAYLPRWTASRRLEAQRERAQWQEWFDAASWR
jgi:uncharacterized membrane protein